MKGRLNYLPLVLYALASFVYLLPMSVHPGSYSVESNGDVRDCMWRLHWGLHAALTGPLGLYDANIFYPEENTYAYMENMLASSFIASPVILLFGNPLLSYNFYLFVSLVLAGFGFYLLAKELTGSTYAALIAGLFYAFAPPRFSRVAQLNIISTQWIPFALFFLHRLVKDARLSNAIPLALFTFIQSISGGHATVFLLTSLAIGVPFFAVSGKKLSDKKFWTAIAASGILTAVLVIPFFYPYLENARSQGFVRSEGAVSKFNPNFQSYFASKTTLHEWIGNHSSFFKQKVLDPASAHLFPGMTLILLAAASLIKIFPSYRFSAMGLKSREGKFYLILMVFSLVASAGTSLGLYSFLYKSLIVFKMIRVPSRFMMLCVLSLCALSAFSLAQIEEIVKARWNKKDGGFSAKRIFLLSLAPLIFIIESINYPIGARMAVYVPPDPVYGWLSKESGDFAVLELPTTPKDDSYYEVFSSNHWKKLVNGLTGYPSPYHESLRKILSGFPDENSRIALSEIIGIRYVIIHPKRYPGKSFGKVKKALAQNPPWLREVGRFGDDLVFEMVEPHEGVEEGVVRKYIPSSGLKGSKISFAIRKSGTDFRDDSEVRLMVNGRMISRFETEGEWMFREVPVPQEIIHKGRNEILFSGGVRGRFGDNSRSEYLIGSTGIESPSDIVVRSAGFYKGNRGDIFVGGVNVSPRGRGYNIVVLNPETGEVESKGLFDTYESVWESVRLSKFVSEIADGKIVVVSAKDNASRRLSSGAVGALMEIGAAGDLRGLNLFSHAIIGIKGSKPGTALESFQIEPSEIAVGYKPEETVVRFALKDLRISKGDD